MKVELLKDHTHKRVGHKIGSIINIEPDERVQRLIKAGVCEIVKVRLSSKKRSDSTIKDSKKK